MPSGAQSTALAFLAANVAELSATVASLADNVNGMRTPKTPPFLNTPTSSLGALTTIVKDALAQTQQMNESNTAGVVSLSAMLATLLARVTTLSTGMEDMLAKQQHSLEVQSNIYASLGQQMEREAEVAIEGGATFASLAACMSAIDDLHTGQAAHQAALTEVVSGLSPVLDDICGHTKHARQTQYDVERLREDHNGTTHTLQKILQQTKAVASLAEEVESLRFSFEQWASASPTTTSPPSQCELSAQSTGTTETTQDSLLEATVDGLRAELAGMRRAAAEREQAFDNDTKAASNLVTRLKSELNTTRAELEEARAKVAKIEMAPRKEDQLTAELAKERNDRAAVEARLRDAITDLRRQRDEAVEGAMEARAARSTEKANFDRQRDAFERQLAEYERQLSQMSGWNTARDPSRVQERQPALDKPDAPLLAVDNPKPEATGDEVTPTVADAPEGPASTAPSTGPVPLQHDNTMSRVADAWFPPTHFTGPNSEFGLSPAQNNFGPNRWGNSRYRGAYRPSMGYGHGPNMGYGYGPGPSDRERSFRLNGHDRAFPNGANSHGRANRANSLNHRA
jgi:hypothetical protein